LGFPILIQVLSMQVLRRYFFEASILASRWARANHVILVSQTACKVQQRNNNDKPKTSNNKVVNQRLRAFLSFQ
ncbi:hypothetical protein MKW98_000857, partial [Papaver atlanticum]